VSSGLAVLIAALAVATAFGLWRRRVDGAVREVDAQAHSVHVHRDVPQEQLMHLQATDIGADLGDQATLVQFSSAFCQPCRATRQVLGQVADMVPGVVHVEVDAEEHLDLVRRLHVLRTPTVFVLDSTGAIRKRASGTPRKADIIAALGEFVATGGSR
jgi:thiol-disulfide isomerase/thioredoxin